MSEINGPYFSVNQVNYNGIQKPLQETQPEVIEEKTQLQDFSNPSAEALGRSMLIKTSDDINHDLKVLLEHPEIAENSDKMFETAYNAAIKSGIANPYEQASEFSTAHNV